MDQDLLCGAQQWQKRNGHKVMPGNFHLDMRRNFPVQSSEQRAERAWSLPHRGYSTAAWVQSRAVLWDGPAEQGD